MPLLRLAIRGLLFHRSMHAGLLCGALLASGILTGALLMGDSVDYSLRAIAEARLGRIEYAIHGGSRFFAQRLAERIQEKDSRSATAAVLALRGMAALPPGNDTARNQINRVQVLGTDAGFWRFANVPPKLALGPQEAAINEKTAAALGVRAGGDLALRIAKAGLLPYDAPLASPDDQPVAVSLVTVKAVLSDDQLGPFSLTANQTTPYNVFVDRTWLQEQTDLAGLANMVLAEDGATLEAAQRALGEAWELEDAGLRLLSHPSGIVQLESNRVFLDEEAVRAAMTIPDASATLTYLVNSITCNGKATPYSFVEAGPVPADMLDGEVAINQWLADQIGAAPGSRLDVAYYRLTPSNTFVEETRTLTVHSVMPMDALGVERELAPVFPGLSDVENCRDWDVGMPMDKDLLNDKANEEYWRAYGQTPKLMTTLAAGQAMWGNRFGSVTAVRFSASACSEAEAHVLLRTHIDPEKIGLRFVPVQQMARDAVAKAIDFGGLFTGMSFFLIVAALILMGLLYVFGLQQRMAEIGTLGAVGYPLRTVRFLFLAETCPTAVLGALLGVVAGAGYARLLLAGLALYWPAAVAGTSIHFHARPITFAYGICGTLACVLAVTVAALWRATRHTPRELLTTDFASAGARIEGPGHAWTGWFASAALLLATVLGVGVWIADPATLTLPFFGVGTLLLIAELGYYAAFLRYLAARPAFKRPRLWKLVVSNLARRRGRSLSVAGLTACGCFLVFAVSAMQENVALHADARNSGTGGFGVYADTTAPMVQTPAELAEAFGANVVPLRVRDGDDAGCLNLNRAQTPRLLGVDPAAFDALGAFVSEGNALWKLLDRELPEGQIPALVGDSDTAMWGLGKKTGVENGDVLPYRD
ncbi:MAG: putative transport system permease protein, partial [Candidatus Hydrogenedentes bacterium]|nr:putative transport system permease protein [Candidatus Hydrogenedentota bacterium]